MRTASNDSIKQPPGASPPRPEQRNRRQLLGHTNNQRVDSRIRPIAKVKPDGRKVGIPRLGTRPEALRVTTCHRVTMQEIQDDDH